MIVLLNLVTALLEYINLILQLSYAQNYTSIIGRSLFINASPKYT